MTGVQTCALPIFCEPRGVAVLVPDEVDQDSVHALIYDELTRGRVPAGAKYDLADVAERLVEAGADGVVLGCSELGLVLAPGSLSVPVLDATALHARAIVDAALALG